VRANVASTPYPNDRLVYVQGRVEETIPACAPDEIAVLRLDTDFFDSTFHEMTHLFPRVAAGGVLIVDDYGYWQGARRAVDRYLHERGISLLLHKIDDTARIALKV
jgi:hypothetical protein